MLPPPFHPGHLVDVDNFVGDQFFPLVERGDGHGGILGVGAVDGRRLLAEVLLGAPLGGNTPCARVQPSRSDRSGA